MVRIEGEGVHAAREGWRHCTERRPGDAAEPSHKPSCMVVQFSELKELTRLKSKAAIRSEREKRKIAYFPGRNGAPWTTTEAVNQVLLRSAQPNFGPFARALGSEAKAKSPQPKKPLYSPQCRSRRVGLIRLSICRPCFSRSWREFRTARPPMGRRFRILQRSAITCRTKVAATWPAWTV